MAALFAETPMGLRVPDVAEHSAGATLTPQVRGWLRAYLPQSRDAQHLGADAS